MYSSAASRSDFGKRLRAAVVKAVDQGAPGLATPARNRAAEAAMASIEKVIEEE